MHCTASIGSEQTVNSLPVNVLPVCSHSSYEWVVIAESWTTSMVLHNVIISVLANRFCMSNRAMSNANYAVSEWRQTSVHERGVIHGSAVNTTPLAKKAKRFTLPSRTVLTSYPTSLDTVGPTA